MFRRVEALCLITWSWVQIHPVAGLLYAEYFLTVSSTFTLLAVANPGPPGFRFEGGGGFNSYNQDGQRNK